MSKKFQTSLLTVILILSMFMMGFTNIDETDTLYDYNYIQTLNGGFVDTIGEIAVTEGLTKEEFKTLCQKPAKDMTKEELAKVNKIREKQIIPDSSTLMQKVITTYDMNNYLSGKYKTPKGFVSVCADVKQYKTLEDFFYGLRLDYEGTYFKPTDESYAVIRFKASNIDKIIIPQSEANGGTYTDPYPFGGAGFTTGNNGRWGSPEWVMTEFAVINDGSQLFEVYADGREELRGIYREEAGQFVKIGKEVSLTDISGNKAEKEIKRMCYLNFINGYADNTFKPEQELTNAEFAVMINKAFNLPTTAEKDEENKENKEAANKCTDIQNHWAKDYISNAINAGVMNLDSNNLFNPQNQINLKSVQSALMLIVEDSAKPNIDEAFELAIKNKIITNINDFATRAEVTYILSNIVK